MSELNAVTMLKELFPILFSQTLRKGNFKKRIKKIFSIYKWKVKTDPKVNI